MLLSRTLDEDLVDRFNRLWTVLLLALCSLGAFLVRYVTPPVSCFTPTDFRLSQHVYIERVCFLKENYSSFAMPAASTGVSYHQWIPIILFLQAVCFAAPNIIWNFFKQYLSINLERTVPSLEQAQVSKPEQRLLLSRNVARVMTGILGRNKFLLGGLYLCTKLLYCINLLGQFLFLTIYFRHQIPIFAGSSLAARLPFHIRPLFQEKVICEFNIRHLSNSQTYSVQCVIPIAEIYTKLFVFLWYWVFFLAVITFLNLLLWAGFLFLPFLRDGRISAHISAFSPTPGSPPDTSTLRRFVSGFLGIDGVFVLSMISRNSSELVAADLTNQLYQVFQQNQPTSLMQPATALTSCAYGGNPGIPDQGNMSPSSSASGATRVEPATTKSEKNQTNSDYVPMDTYSEPLVPGETHL